MCAYSRSGKFYCEIIRFPCQQHQKITAQMITSSSGRSHVVPGYTGSMYMYSVGTYNFIYIHTCIHTYLHTYICMCTCMYVVHVCMSRITYIHESYNKGTRESCSLLLFCCCYMYGFRKSFFIGLGFGGWWDGGYSLCNFFRLGGW